MNKYLTHYWYVQQFININLIISWPNKQNIIKKKQVAIVFDKSY